MKAVVFFLELSVTSDLREAFISVSLYTMTVTWQKVKACERATELPEELETC